MMLTGAVVAGTVTSGAAHAETQYDGSSPSSAAASCWEVKQVAPAAPSGVYWLLTPALKAPQQFYCDQQSDGGGWVLIGKGREGWQEYNQGQGDISTLLSPPEPRTPSYFPTVQLSATTVDQLLNNRAVKDLPDGIRLRRARTADGTQWQETRMRLSKRDRFAWAFGASNPMQGFGFDGSNSNGGSTNNFGNDSTWRRVTFSWDSNQNWTAGFAYGSNATGGSTDASNFLYSALSQGRSPRPYTEVYMRPRLTQADIGWQAIPDEGTTAIEQRAVASNYVAAGQWGVTGHMNGISTESSNEVQSFVQIGNRVFVAGNFEYVQRGSGGADRTRQPSLAAFDAATGAFIPSFNPSFDNQVHSIDVLPNGKLVAVGDFTTVNGASATGTVVLDPITGAKDPSWNTYVENNTSSGGRSIRSVSVSGDYVYIAGAFTHLRRDESSNQIFGRNAARIAWANGTPDGGWNPNFNGTVVSNDAADDGARVYNAGYFTSSQGADALRAAAVETAAGAPLATPQWSPVWSNSNKQYQQAIRQVGERVFVGGSEHSLFGFDTSTFERTSGTTTHGVGGDFQDIDTGHGVVYAGCHCGSWAYQDGVTWSNLGSAWTQVEKIQYLSGWDAVSGDIIPTFTPQLQSGGGAGVWALYVAADGTLWAGGDLTGARRSASQGQWAGGFVRFPLVDHTAPSTPTNFRPTGETATTVTFAWNSASDSAGPVTYDLIRNDRVIATTSNLTIAVPKDELNRFFVRASDGAGNRSASTAVYDLASPPTTTTTTTSTTTSTTTTTTVPETTTTVPGTPVTGTVIAFGSPWKYRYELAAPASNWATAGFDDSTWTTGATPIGWGSASIATDLNRPTAERASTIYQRNTVDITDLSTVQSLRLTVIADDGAVIRVNGTEIARERMSPGTISHTTSANATISTTNARANPTVVDVPLNLLVEGTNTIAVDTHLNYRGTSNASFDLQAELTR